MSHAQLFTFTFEKSKLTRRLNNDPDYKFIRDYTLTALHIGFAPNMLYLYKFGKKFIRKGEVETLRGQN